MLKKEVCLFQLYYMIHYIENEIHNGRIDYINNA